jgi:uncharacterized repeat protein (TIGR03843 family)
VTPDARGGPADEADIETGDLVLHGRIMPASNATFLAETRGVRVVYKPVRGERPLWDFPDGTLAHRERAAYLVSRALGWDVVPETILRDGPHGPGMVQRWVDTDPDAAAVDVVAAGHAPAGWLEVFEGVDEHDRPVHLVHEDTPALRRMAVFDVLVNNADRKGGHVLAMAGGHRHGVDHGVSFHTEVKLRSVLWGWAGSPLTGEETAGVRRALADDDLRLALEDLLAVAEAEMFRARAEALLADGCLPRPGGGWPSIPWPPF